MEFQPYPYQEECLTSLDKARRAGTKRALVTMATGLGKTVTVAFDVRKWRQKHSGRILYLCHQNDILEQARKTFESVLGQKYTFGYYHGNEKTTHSVDCLFASFQTMQRHREKFKKDEFAYIVVDESHHGPASTYKPTLKYFQPQFLLGITATPERADLQNIRHIYGKEIFSLPLEEALVRGLLTKIDYRLLTDEIQDLKVLKLPTGEVSIDKLNRELFIPKRDEEIVRILQKHIQRTKDPRVMIFCRSVQHCNQLAKKLPQSVSIHSGLSKTERQKRLIAFRKGDNVKVAITVDVFNEGIDVPEANILVFLRSTSSQTVFLQQLGRGLRKMKKKKKVLVLDVVGNIERLEIIDKLHKSVRKKYKERQSYNVAAIRSLEIDMGEIHFTEVTRSVLDCVERIKEKTKQREIISKKYTKEFLIQQLRSLAQELKRTPFIKDVDIANKRGMLINSSALIYKFGLYSNALKAAGLPFNRKRFKKTDLLEQLRLIAQELGRSPTKEDIDRLSKKRRSASINTFYKYFGGFSKALKLAGLEVNKYGPICQLTNKEIIKQFQKLAEELRRTPTQKDTDSASRQGKCVGVSILQRRFGSFSNLLRAAGLKIPRTKNIIKKELVTQMKDLARELSRTPRCCDIEKGNKAGKCVSLTTFVKYFGSISATRKAAGLE